MQLTEWLESEKGRSLALSKFIGVTRSAVSQWKTNGVPLDHMRTVSKFTGGAVTLEDMVPEKV